MKRRGLRMALGKVKKRGFHCLPSIRIVVLFFFFNCYFLFCDLTVWVIKSRNEMKRSLKVLKRNPEKYAEAGVNKNKQIKYTKKLIKKITVGKCAEIGNKCNSIIRTKEVDQAWWDMWYRNQLPSQRHVSKSRNDGLSFFLFSFSFSTFFWFIFSIFNFQNLGLGLEWQLVTLSHISHITWHSHKSRNNRRM